MSSLPNDIFYNITNFLPNDDITDLMLMSRNFNAHVTLRLKKIDQEMATMNQCIKSFMPNPVPKDDCEWIPQLNLKRFEPIGSKAKKRMKEVIETQIANRNCLCDIHGLEVVKEGMSLERFDTPTFLRILGALIATPKFRQKLSLTDFLPNDDITDLMFLSRKYYGLVTPRLRKIDQEMSTMNQSIKSFTSSPAPTDNEWIPQLNLKRFEPIGSAAKNQMKKTFQDRNNFLSCFEHIRLELLDKFKKGLSLERFDDLTFLRISSKVQLFGPFCAPHHSPRKLLSRKVRELLRSI